MALPSWLAHLLKKLEDDIVVEQLQKAISSLLPGKSFMSDGYNKFYKTSMKELKHLTSLLNSFNSISESHAECVQVHITIIPKEGKDPQLCSSFRPISLINTDAKIYAMLIVLRLNQIFWDLVHHDKVGFVPFREAWDNTLKTFSLIPQINLSHFYCMLLSLDAEKTFDRVMWTFIEAVLEILALDQLCFIESLLSIISHKLRYECMDPF